jgi:DNA polymerase/3'-5' exonuclease PolX
MRIEATGALRRKETSIDSIEMIASPQTVKKNGYWNDQAVNLGGEIAGSNRLEAGIELLTRKGVMKRFQGNPGTTDYATESPSSCYSLQYKQVTVTIYSVASHSDWGVEFLLRTGDNDFVDFLRARAAQKGFNLNQGRLEKFGRSVGAPEEIDVLRTLGLEWVEPENRNQHFINREDVAVRSNPVPTL